MHKDKIYIIGNWKMNPNSFREAEKIFNEIDSEISENRNNCKVALCVPSIFLNAFKQRENIDLGAQNIFWEDSGAFTGEISAKMISETGASFVILGHSERRKYLEENDEMVNLKIKSALNNKLKPILCIGENWEERKSGEMETVIVRQLKKALEGIDEDQIWQRLVVAYEPVWAIGSGKIPSSDDIMSVGLLVKKVISKLYGNREIAENIPILYGGSVNSENALDIINKTGLNGLLIGGASLKPGEFVKIVKKFK